MASEASADFEREHRLIEQLELRIATADTDVKFENLIQKFLPALLMKLASESERNRNLTIKVCQHVSQRIKLTRSIQLPIPGLLKNFKDSPNAFVRRFSLLFLQQAFERVTSLDSVKLLPEVLQFSVPASRVFDATTRKMWSVAFDFLLDALRCWKAPERGSKDDRSLRETFNLADAQCDMLAGELCRLLLYDPKMPNPHHQLDEDFKAVYEKQYRQRSQLVPRIGELLFSSIFKDNQRLIPAVVMATDANATVSSLSDTMFKQCSFDLESSASVDALFGLYEFARPKLQTKILSLLAKSKASTAQSERIYSMIAAQLNSQETSLEISKLRSALFQYLTWTVRVSDNVELIGRKTQGILKDYIESQGWPAMRDRSPGEIDLRSKAYESIGLLTDKNADAAMDYDLMVWLFTSLRCDTTADLRSSIEEALGRVLTSMGSQDAEYTEKLRNFLLWNATADIGDEDPIYYFPTITSTKYIATRFANKCLTFEDPVARLIDVFAVISTERKELVEEGARGLDPYWHLANQKLVGTVNYQSTMRLPDLTDLVDVLFADSSHVKFDFRTSPAFIAASVSFCFNVLVTQAVAGQEYAIADFTDWTSHVNAALENNQKARDNVKRYLRSIDGNTLASLSHRSMQGLSLGSSEAADTSVHILSLRSDISTQAEEDQLQNLARAGLSQNNVQVRAAKCFGILTSGASKTEIIVNTELDKSQRWNEALGAEAVSIRGHLLAAAFTIGASNLRGHVVAVRNGLIPMLKTLHEIITTSHDIALVNAAFLGLAQIAIRVDPNVAADFAPETTWNKILIEGKKENERAILALGRVLNRQLNGLDMVQRSEAIERILKLHEIKKAEFQFALGETLVVAAAGFKSASMLADVEVDTTLPSWGYHEPFLIELIDKCIDACNQTKPALRKAAAIWLLNMAQFIGDLPPVQTRLRDLQTSFARLLNDRDEIVQETGSRGLSIVYEKGDKNLRDDLVRELVGSFTSTNAKMSGNVEEDTQLFEAGALPTEGGQSVTTYKDIVSLATEMGDPSLVYKFMNLASNNAIWTSRAAFGRFGLSNILADSTYLAENKKFYPKLFRYRFDPNPNVQRSMNDIWKALVKDPNAVIDQNFELIMEDLLKSALTGKEWRAREASCAAIMDLVQGRDLDKFEKYLDQVWNVAFKVLDDVKETVRLAAMKLCRTLTGMLIRNLEVGQGTTKRATVMLDHAVPFLLKQMDGGSAQEVQQYATVSLLEVVKKSPPRSLQAFAPMVLETLVNSLSSLEHESINYLHLNADKYGLTANKLDSMRVSSVNSSPITEAIDSCLESVTTSTATDSDTAMHGDNEPQHKPMEEAMRRLQGTFKTAIGLPSRVGLSRVLVTLVVRYHSTFRPYADRFAQLTRKNILDRNATISIGFSTSLGYLMRLASAKEIQATSDYAQKLYFDSQELSQRSVAGEILQAISKTSNDVFMNYASTFLPFAFIGRNDTDVQVRERFELPWKDNVGGSRAVQLYLKEITNLINANIKSPLWPIKHACCLSVATIVEMSDGQTTYSEAEAHLIWPLVTEALGGKTWDGKEKVVSAYPKYVRLAKVSWKNDEVSSEMKKLALRESKRTNYQYRPYAIEALNEFAVIRPDLDMSVDVVEYLHSLVGELTNEDAMDVDDSKDLDARSRASTTETTLKVAGACAFGVLPTRPKSDVLEQAMGIAKKLHAQHSTLIDVALFEAISQFLLRLRDGRRRAANQSDKENASGTESLEMFSEGLRLAFLSHTSPSELERVRRSLVNLALALAESEICIAASRKALSLTLETWSQAERSRPLREDMQKIKKILEDGPP